MAKFRVHIFEEVRSAYEVEAENEVDAMIKVYDDLNNLDAIESELTGDIGDAVAVDPLLPDGTPDYTKLKWLSLKEHQ